MNITDAELAVDDAEKEFESRAGALLLTIGQFAGYVQMPKIPNRHLLIGQTMHNIDLDRTSMMNAARDLEKARDALEALRKE